MQWANGTKIFLRQATMKFASSSQRLLDVSPLKPEATKIAQLFARFAEPDRPGSLSVFAQPNTNHESRRCNDQRCADLQTRNQSG